MGCNVSRTNGNDAEVFSPRGVVPQALSKELQHLTTLSTYLPQDLLRKFESDPNVKISSSSYKFEGAILMIDISNFTILTEKLANEGKNGAEKMTTFVNVYFAAIINVVYEHGGDVHRFAGDALIVIFSNVHKDTKYTQKQLALKAIQCGLAIQQQHATYEVPSADVTLSLHMGVATGEMYGMMLGGVDDKWRTNIDGPTFAQLASVIEQSKMGEVAISKETFAVVQDCVVTKDLSTTDKLVLSVKQGIPVKPYARATLKEYMLPPVQKFVDKFVQKRVAESQSFWLTETRHMNILFINLPKKNMTPEENLSFQQDMLTAIQTTMHKYDGEVFNYLTDEKGTLALAGFGSPVTHEDDAMRSVKAALEIKKYGDQKGVSLSIGVTQGTALLGSIGSTARQDYNILGDPVNLAARLMKKTDNILCSKDVMAATQENVEYLDQGTLVVKGKKDPVAVFRPTNLKTLDRASSIIAMGSNFVAREAELQTFNEALEKFNSNQRSSLLLVQGSSGIGKKSLIVRALRSLSGLQVIMMSCEESEQKTLLYPFKPVGTSVMEHLLKANNVSQAEDTVQVREKLVQGLYSPYPYMLPYLSLLNSLFETKFKETRDSLTLAGDKMYAVASQLLTTAISKTIAKKSIMLVMLNYQWVDEASKKAVMNITSSIPTNIFVAVGSRQLENEKENEALTKRASTVIKIDAFTLEETSKFLQKYMHVKSVAEKLTQFVHENSGGSPRYMAELAGILMDKGYVVIDEHRIQAGLSSSFPMHIEQLDIPQNLQALLLASLDKLDANSYLLLKIASVLGQTFSIEELKAGSPPNNQKGASEMPFERTMSDLVVKGWLRRKEATNELEFECKVAKETIYGNLLEQQRKDIHLRIAQFYSSFMDSQEEKLIMYAHHLLNAATNGADIADVHSQLSKRINLVVDALNSKSQFSKVEIYLTKYLDIVRKLRAVDPNNKELLEEFLNLTRALVEALLHSIVMRSVIFRNILEEATSVCPLNHPAAFQLFFWLGMNYFTTEQHEKCLQVTEKIAIIKDDTPVQTICYHVVNAVVYNSRAEFEKARKHLSAAFDEFNKDPSVAFQEFPRPVNLVLMMFANCRIFFATGNYRLADELYQSGYKLHDKYPEESTAIFNILAPYHHVLNKNHAELQNILNLSIPKPDNVFGVRVHQIYTAYIKVLQGDIAAGDQLEELLVLMKAEAPPNHIFYAVLVEYFLLKAKTEPSPYLEKAETIIKQCLEDKQMHLISEFWRLRALVYIRRLENFLSEHPEDFTAEPHVDELRNIIGEIRMSSDNAIQVAEQQEAKAFKIRALLGYANFIETIGGSLDGKKIIDAVGDYKMFIMRMQERLDMFTQAYNSIEPESRYVPDMQEAATWLPRLANVLAKSQQILDSTQ